MVFLYRSIVAFNLPLNTDTSNPILLCVVLSHFRFGFAGFRDDKSKIGIIVSGIWIIGARAHRSNCLVGTDCLITGDTPASAQFQFREDIQVLNEWFFMTSSRQEIRMGNIPTCYLHQKLKIRQPDSLELPDTYLQRHSLFCPGKNS